MTHWQVDITRPGQGRAKLLRWIGDADGADEAEGAAWQALKSAWAAMATTTGLDPANPPGWDRAIAKAVETGPSGAERWMIGRALFKTAVPTPEALAAITASDHKDVRAALYGIFESAWRQIAAIEPGEAIAATFSATWPANTFATASVTTIRSTRAGQTRPVPCLIGTHALRGALAILAAERVKPRFAHGEVQQVFFKRAPLSATLLAAECAARRDGWRESLASTDAVLRGIGCADLAEAIAQEASER